MSTQEQGAPLRERKRRVAKALRVRRRQAMLCVDCREPCGRRTVCHACAERRQRGRAQTAAEVMAIIGDAIYVPTGLQVTHASLG